MKQIFSLMLLIFVAAIGWRIGGSLSSDAMGMAIGMLFGIMAGIPTALLVLASERRREQPRAADDRERSRNQHGQLPYAQPPVIVVTGSPTQLPAGPIHPPQAGYPPHLHQGYDSPASSPPQRTFRIVGEHDESLDDW
ncbi:MAG: hypothetical protein KDE54_07700 [Caldilineaceae bacterium]|nr:hypothetical protein [Caldilineaceae bacterium]MCB0098445.1 hypothetical protein [Caldilineaceae bacterium]MCB0144546.1 hypothetical protein [Caldilineaceae bacterium]